MDKMNLTSFGLPIKIATICCFLCSENKCELLCKTPFSVLSSIKVCCAHAASSYQIQQTTVVNPHLPAQAFKTPLLTTCALSHAVAYHATLELPILPPGSCIHSSLFRQVTRAMLVGCLTLFEIIVCKMTFAKATHII